MSGLSGLTRLLWRACSRVAVKRKQRQGTPAARAHWTYLWGKELDVQAPPAPPQAPYGPTYGHATWRGSQRPGLCCRWRPVFLASGLSHRWSHSAARSLACPGDTRGHKQISRPGGREDPERGRGGSDGGKPPQTS